MGVFCCFCGIYDPTKTTKHPHSSSAEQSHKESMTEERPGRTFELWFLAAGLLGVSLTGWLRLQFVIGAWDFLQQAGFQPGPAYQAILGAAWGIGGLICAAGLLLRQPWAPRLTRITVAVLAAWFWVDFLAFTRAANANQNWPYPLALTLVSLFLTFGILALDRQKRFFRSSQ
jgi:hypothetical protein